MFGSTETSAAATQGTQTMTALRTDSVSYLVFGLIVALTFLF